jgi:NADH dehydrogenase (ubiquinone) Fe-S protein 1
MVNIASVLSARSSFKITHVDCF